MDQQLYNTSNTQGRGTSLDSLFGQFSTAGLGAPPPGLMDQTGRRGGDSMLGAPHQEYQPMEGNFSWTDNYSRFAAPHNFTAVETLMSELAPEDHFGGGDPHLTSILQQFLMKQQLPPQHGMPPSYIPDDLLMNTTAGGGNKPTGAGAGGNRSRGGSFHVKLENQQQQMQLLEQQQQQPIQHHQAPQQSHLQGQQGQQMPQTGHNQGNPGDIYGALELLSAYLNTTPGQFPEPSGYPSQLGAGNTVAGQQSHLGDPYFDLLNGGGQTQPNPYQYMNPYYPDYLNFDPATNMKTGGPHSAATGNKPSYQQAASHYMSAGGHPGAPGGYPMDQQVQHELLQQLFKEDQQHHRQYDDQHPPQHPNQQGRDTAAVSQQQGKQPRNAPSAVQQNKATKSPVNPAGQVQAQHIPSQMNPAAASRMKQEAATANMHGNKMPVAATTAKNDKMPPVGYPPRMGGPPPGKPGMMMNDWTDAITNNDYLPDSIKKSLLPASVRDQLMKKSQEYYEYMRRGPKDQASGGMHHGGLPIPASSTHLLQGFASNPRGMLPAGFPAMPPRRIGQLTAEERRNKIEKYLTKRKKRSWSKKISYDCRKRVADSRLRIKGRFVTKEQAVAVLGADDQMNLTEIKEMLVTKFGVAPMPRRRGSGGTGDQKGDKIAENLAENLEECQNAEDDDKIEEKDLSGNELEEGLRGPPSLHIKGLFVNKEQGATDLGAEDQISLNEIKEMLATKFGIISGDQAENQEGNVANVAQNVTTHGVNVAEMRPEELSGNELEKGQLDSQHFDVLGTNKLIASVTNNVA